MISPPKVLIPLGLLSLAAAGLYLWKFTPSGERPGISLESGSSSAQQKGVRPATEPLDASFKKLSATGNAGALQTLKDLQTKLKSLPADEAANWIRSFITSGEDKSTGLTFEINPDGTLKEWPTFRTFLLDTLLSIDPAATAALSRSVLAAPTSADEWALALRNVGKVENSPETNTYLRERTEALINNPDWQANPSIGYLNAFDVLVHTNATASTPLLSSLIQRKDRKDLAHAGFITLDRLVQKSPTDVLTRLAADTALLASRPEMAAQEFARADLRDPAQQAIIKTWLLNPARTGTELRAFAGVYPNNNSFISNNLLTTTATPTGSDLATHDRKVLEIIQSWKGGPEFQPVGSHLESILARLRQFTAGEPAETNMNLQNR